jgi:hypothetical protein
LAAHSYRNSLYAINSALPWQRFGAESNSDHWNFRKFVKKEQPGRLFRAFPPENLEISYDRAATTNQLSRSTRRANFPKKRVAKGNFVECTFLMLKDRQER